MSTSTRPPLVPGAAPAGDGFGVAEHTIAVRRTARYATLGVPSAGVRELWYVCHGYAQLAADFIRDFAPLDDGTRVVVAPEALSRFYVTADPSQHSQAPVGATWMTREARLAEIDDYVTYLDALHTRVRGQLSESGVSTATLRVRVLGFSQGAATAARWVARGSVQPQELILWGGLLPADAADGAGPGPLARTAITIVIGDRDRFATAERMAEQEALFARLGLTYRRVGFAGGHRLDRGTLVALAERGPGRG